MLLNKYVCVTFCGKYKQSKHIHKTYTCIAFCSIIMNRDGGVIVNVLVLSAVYRGFKFRSV